MLVADLPLPVRTCGVQNHFLGALEDRPRSSPDVPGQQRHPFSSRHRSIEEAATLNAARPEPIPDRRAGIHPLGHLCAATLRCGMVVAPKRAETSRHPVRVAFYAGSPIRASENCPSTHSDEYLRRGYFIPLAASPPSC